jgi:hypothetical protein
MITDKLCPLARCFGVNDLQAKCMGSECALYREELLPIPASEPTYISAIQREMACMAQDEGKGREAKCFQKKATARVSANPEGFGVKIPRRGYCGLGGRP